MAIEKNKKSRAKRSTETLNLIARDFAHEITSLRMAADAHQQIINSPGYPQIVRNSLILSFAIHFRNIFDFLYGGDKAQPTDAVAEDFFSDDSLWQSKCPPKSDYLVETKKRLNKELAHLTYTRTERSLESQPWDFARIMNDLTPTIVHFKKRVSNTEAKDRLEEELEHYIWQTHIK